MWLDILLVLLVAGAVLLAAVKILRDRRSGRIATIAWIDPGAR